MKTSIIFKTASFSHTESAHPAEKSDQSYQQSQDKNYNNGNLAKLGPHLRDSQGLITAKNWFEYEITAENLVLEKINRIPTALTSVGNLNFQIEEKRAEQ